MVGKSRASPAIATPGWEPASMRQSRNINTQAEATTYLHPLVLFRESKQQLRALPVPAPEVLVVRKRQHDPGPGCPSRLARAPLNQEALFCGLGCTKAVSKGHGPGSRKAMGGRLPPHTVVSAGSGPLAILGKPLRPRIDERTGASPLVSAPVGV